MSTQLEGLRPWIIAVAGKYSRDWHMVQDLAQEGWIAAWKAEQKSLLRDNPHQLEAFMKQAARWRILKCISDGAWLTDRERRGWGTADHHQHVPATPALFDDENELTEQLSTMHEQLEAAYHSGEISRAVDSLTPKQSEYVRLRFWKHYDTDELTRHFGYAPYGLWAHARKKLQAALAHMEKVV